MLDTDLTNPDGDECVWRATVGRKLKERQIPKGQDGVWYSLNFAGSGAWDYPLENISLTEDACRMSLLLG